MNHSGETFKIEEGMKIAQMVVKPVVKVEITEVEELSDDTERKENGFGSSGI